VARQKRMRFEEEDFYVDLVFYNFLLKCFVLIDLKVGKLTHQDVGQMESYVRMFDVHDRPPKDNPTIGLILCSSKNEAIAKYSVLNDGRQIFAAKYVKVLPTENENFGAKLNGNATGLTHAPSNWFFHGQTRRPYARS
jgi:hypothetical protein